MEKFTDFIGWLVAVLFAFVFYNVKTNRKADSDKFNALFREQKIQGERLVHIETDVQNINAHLIRTLESIEVQCRETAKEITDIKVSVAKIPSRSSSGDVQ